MAKNSEKADVIPNLDDLLQCPVCYEIPSGQIFQCNEGHHVCGRCKARLDLCPVCRAMFFGTRNYAMEELIHNINKFKGFKLGGKMALSSEDCTQEECSAETKTETVTMDVQEPVQETGAVTAAPAAPAPRHRAPMPCKGLFRCLCCKDPVRLPLGRLLNHLRYFHARDLLEGKSENGHYLQAWHISTVPARHVIALRITDMGQFFVTIEMKRHSICAWIAMAAAEYVAHGFCYTITLAGLDREAFFTDSVVTVKSCEGTLKRTNNCLMVTGSDARALINAAALNVRIAVRRDINGQALPRAILRVANTGEGALEPLIQGLQEDVERLTRAFTTLGRNIRTADIDSIMDESSSVQPTVTGSSPRTPVTVSSPRTPVTVSSPRTPATVSSPRTPVTGSPFRTPVMASPFSSPATDPSPRPPVPPRTPAPPPSDVYSRSARLGMTTHMLHSLNEPLNGRGFQTRTRGPLRRF